MVRFLQVFVIALCLPYLNIKINTCYKYILHFRALKVLCQTSAVFVATKFWCGTWHKEECCPALFMWHKEQYCPALCKKWPCLYFCTLWRRLFLDDRTLKKNVVMAVKQL